MAATNKEPLLFSRVTYGSMILSAVGLLATVAYGMGDPMLRVFAEALLGWIMIALVAIWARLTAKWLRTMDAEIAQIESAAQQQ
jgi:hypothetical protein